MCPFSYTHLTKVLHHPVSKLPHFFAKFHKEEVQHATEAVILNIEHSFRRENIGKFTDAISTNNNGKILVLIF